MLINKNILDNNTLISFQLPFALTCCEYTVALAFIFGVTISIFRVNGFKQTTFSIAGKLELILPGAVNNLVKTSL